MERDSREAGFVWRWSLPREAPRRLKAMNGVLCGPARQLISGIPAPGVTLSFTFNSLPLSFSPRTAPSDLAALHLAILLSI